MSSSQDDWDSDNDSRRYESNESLRASFATVTQNLMDLGLIPLSEFANKRKSEIPGFEFPFLAPEREYYSTTSSATTKSTAPHITSQFNKDPSSLTMEYVTQLHQICQETFGNADALSFEFLEENGPNSESHRSYVEKLYMLV